ncbi:MAG: hypothetical protein DCF13_01480 [Flavobacteriaceae bacterium]|nr:MAG: hypothetical protein DCF13_01480 [Flavobacteriaceae bacterium]
MAWAFSSFAGWFVLAKNTRRDEGWNVGFWLAGCTKVHPYRNIIPKGIVLRVWLYVYEVIRL